MNVFVSATPAAAYANSASREWESFDGIWFNQTIFDEGCTDIAAQLVDSNSFIDLVIGGGRRKFLRKEDFDHANATLKGDRIDNRNLIEEWSQKMKSKNLKHKFLWNATDFMSLRPEDGYDRILGLMSYDHMDWELDRVNNQEQPSIVEMTLKAIQILRRNPKGFYLLVEGGKIDHGHHAGNAHKALSEFVIFDQAIEESLKVTDKKDTLTVVTADHSHV